jgi:hypothetical protein
MKIYVPLALIILITLSCLAADSLGADAPFRIIDYRPLGFQTQSLSISPTAYLSGGNSLDTGGYYDKLDNGSSTDGTLGASALYYLRRQGKTADLELSTNANISSMIYSRSNDQSREGENTFYLYQNDPGVYYDIYNSTRYRKYIYNGMFIECAVSPSISHHPIDRRTTNNARIAESGIDSLLYYSSSRNIENYQSLTFSSGLNASIGTGWIADVTGAAIALHMVDCIGRLNGRPQQVSGNTMQRLAETIDRLRRRRIFDSRLADIESIDTLCRFLLSEKITDTASVRLAMEINDIWNYGFNQQRYYGKEFKCTPTATVSYYNRQSKSMYYSIDSTGPHDSAITPRVVAEWPKTMSDTTHSYRSDYLLSYGALLYGGFSKPYGRFLELDGSIEVSGTMNTLYDSTYYDINDQGLFKGTYPNVTGKVSLALSWFPTIRSTITFHNQFVGSADFDFRSRSISGNTFYNSYDSRVYSQGRLFYSELSSSLQVTYYVSPRCSYQIQGSARYASGTKRNFSTGSYASTAGIRNCDFSVWTSLSYSLF